MQHVEVDLLLDVIANVPLIPPKARALCVVRRQHGVAIVDTGPPGPVTRHGQGHSSRQPEYYGYAATISPAQGATFRRRIRGVRVVFSPFSHTFVPIFCACVPGFCQLRLGPVGFYTSQLSTIKV